MIIKENNNSVPGVLLYKTDQKKAGELNMYSDQPSYMVIPGSWMQDVQGKDFTIEVSIMYKRDGGNEKTILSTGGNFTNINDMPGIDEYFFNIGIDSNTGALFMNLKSPGDNYVNCISGITVSSETKTTIKFKRVGDLFIVQVGGGTEQSLHNQEILKKYFDNTKVKFLEWYVGKREFATNAYFTYSVFHYIRLYINNCLTHAYEFDVDTSKNISTNIIPDRVGDCDAVIYGAAWVGAMNVFDRNIITHEQRVLMRTSINRNIFDKYFNIDATNQNMGTFTIKKSSVAYSWWDALAYHGHPYLSGEFEMSIPDGIVTNNLNMLIGISDNPASVLNTSTYGGVDFGVCIFGNSAIRVVELGDLYQKDVFVKPGDKLMVVWNFGELPKIYHNGVLFYTATNELLKIINPMYSYTMIHANQPDNIWIGMRITQTLITVQGHRLPTSYNRGYVYWNQCYSQRGRNLNKICIRNMAGDSTLDMKFLYNDMTTDGKWMNFNGKVYAQALQNTAWMNFINNGIFTLSFQFISDSIATTTNKCIMCFADARRLPATVIFRIVIANNQLQIIIKYDAEYTYKIPIDKLSIVPGEVVSVSLAFNDTNMRVATKSESSKLQVSLFDEVNLDRISNILNIGNRHGAGEWFTGRVRNIRLGNINLSSDELIAIANDNIVL